MSHRDRAEEMSKRIADREKEEATKHKGSEIDDFVKFLRHLKEVVNNC